MNRECGPECGLCGAVSRIDPANKYKSDEFFATGCQNIFLQRGVFRKLVVGESQIAGFGTYAAEPVKKGESFSEYIGEVRFILKNVYLPKVKLTLLLTDHLECRIRAAWTCI